MIPHPDAIDPRADAAYHAGALAAERGLAGIHSQRIEHIAKVEPRSDDLDLDLARLRRSAIRGRELEAIELPFVRGVELVVFREGNGKRGCQPDEPRQEPLTSPP